MSDRGFIQFIRSKAVEEFIRAHPLAFAILSLIAQRAKWKESDSSSSEIGEAYIAASDFEGFGKSKGMTRQEFRTNLNKIVNSQFATIESTNKGTIVKLINSDIYNVSPKPINQPINQQSTSNQPLKKKVRKERTLKDNSLRSLSQTPLSEKSQIMEFIELAADEHEKLKAEFGELLPAMLDKLNAYKGSSGKRYKSDYHTLRGWVKDKILEEKARKTAFEKTSGSRRIIPEAVGKADEITTDEGM